MADIEKIAEDLSNLTVLEQQNWQHCWRKVGRFCCRCSNGNGNARLRR